MAWHLLWDCINLITLLPLKQWLMHITFILTFLCVHVCVSDRSGMFGGHRTRLVVHDLCTCYTLFCVWSSLGVGTEADAIWKQELKWTQSGSSSWRDTHHLGAGAEAARHNQAAGAEADTIREQQLKWNNQGAAAEVSGASEVACVL